MRYKVGDKVRVRWDLEVGEKYGSKKFVCALAKYRGMIREIADVTSYGEYIIHDMCHYYTDEMLRPAEFKIWCETEEEKQAVLEELEKEGYVLENVLFSNVESKKSPVYFLILNNGALCGTSKEVFDEEKCEELTSFEFTGIDFSEKIIITKTRTGATATYGDKTVTTEGEFDDASRQALAEVLCPFKVGDKVKSKMLKIHGKIEKVQIDGKITVGFSNDSSMNCSNYELEPYTEPLYNAKLFCIEGSSQFKKGVIYEIKDGKFIPENNFLLGDDPFEDIKNVNERLNAQFMEIKED